jgi:hypothetical protein
MSSLDKYIDTVTMFQANEKAHIKLIDTLNIELAENRLCLATQQLQNNILQLEKKQMYTEVSNLNQQKRHAISKNTRIKQYKKKVCTKPYKHTNKKQKLTLNTQHFYCTMCLEDGDSKTSSNVHLACGHTYHFKCFMDYIEKSDAMDKCIVCRAQYTMPNVLDTIQSLKKDNLKKETTIEIQIDQIFDMREYCHELEARSMYSISIENNPTVTASVQRRLDILGIDVSSNPMPLLEPPTPYRPVTSSNILTIEVNDPNYTSDTDEYDNDSIYSTEVVIHEDDMNPSTPTLQPQPNNIPIPAMSLPPAFTHVQPAIVLQTQEDDGFLTQMRNTVDQIYRRIL